jgi:hypothetical protein
MRGISLQILAHPIHAVDLFKPKARYPSIAPCSLDADFHEWLPTERSRDLSSCHRFGAVVRKCSSAAATPEPTGCPRRALPFRSRRAPAGSWPRSYGRPGRCGRPAGDLRQAAGGGEKPSSPHPRCRSHLAHRIAESVFECDKAHRENRNSPC